MDYTTILERLSMARRMLTAMMTEAIEARLPLKPAIWMRARVATMVALDWNA